jgi:cytochrome c-type biogenesis protein CcmH/NrfF
MRRYTLVSGVFLTLLTCVQLLRIILRWPVRVAGIDVPLWVSGIAAVIVGSLAIWAFRARAHQDHAAAV